MRRHIRASREAIAATRDAWRTALLPPRQTPIRNYDALQAAAVTVQCAACGGFWDMSHPHNRCADCRAADARTVTEG